MMKTVKSIVQKLLLLSIVATFVMVISSCSTHQRYPAPAQNIYNDPVCGEFVKSGSALTYQYQGSVYYFDSEECLAVFTKNPEKFTKTSYKRGNNHMGFSKWGWWVPVMIATMAVVMIIGVNH
ncbi:YHS domain-containing protein [Gillisia sp. Hel_I_86]|uniref:YHS domain-containing protein n=1 Tax=Gillisia sp. Hel_I_86 TaxID=1249981 RepID=UPI001C985BBF|nr:YHS domain-containing protein [Gillisia sp. Hel_I_86]